MAYLNKKYEEIEASPDLLEQKQTKAIDEFHESYEQADALEQAIEKAFNMYASSKDKEKTEESINSALGLVEETADEELSEDARALVEELQNFV